ncbi:carboxylic ester hydrolase-17 [Coleophoma crateriformis]|uniref:Carboxylic ester hydrolase n=1 Tax=Coleophoma crateriformis TaxID=565419 RepID=A0A3D8SYR4_9HELO|nr:carboxylic ester hydrolase-17 [Coleophoma crateriformis]
MRLLLAVSSLLSVAQAAFSCSNITLFGGVTETDTFYVTSSSLVAADAATAVPEHCNITARIGGRITVWAHLPTEWNGRFSQYGCGGGCGYNPFEDGTDTAAPLKAGYAISTTDMGNPERNYIAFYNNIQGKLDWGYLATHLTAMFSKQLIKAYYGSAPTYSYHIGGSTGGRQGLVEAQRYPDEFDGIVAIAPAYNETGVTTYQITWMSQVAVANDSALTPLITANDTALIYAATLDACDELDGLKDGIIVSPRLCNFSVSTLACSNGSSPLINATACLSPTAVSVAEKIYSGPVNSAGIHLTLEGLLPGSEANWDGAYIASPPGYGAQGSFYAFAVQYLSYYAFFPDPPQPIQPVDFSMDTPLSATAYIENFEYGGNADLQKFQQLGGKLVMLQGLLDEAVAPWFAQDYFERVVTAMGGRQEVDPFFRYFEMPGVNHVSGGPGADTFDELALIAAWVENGTAPEVIIASHVVNDVVEFTRPLYPWPLQAYYNSTAGGNVSEASSFYAADTAGPLRSL